MAHIDPSTYHSTVSKLRSFFEGRGFIEVPTQDRLSILAACEDPTTVATYTYEGQLWPLPQTGQMWLEYELLTNPDAPGYYCVSTSYRQEPNPQPGRHETIFPMFEFECHGGIAKLETLERELLEYLRFGPANSFLGGTYNSIAAHYDVDEIDAEHEAKVCRDFGDVFFLKHFPERTHPFWNMRQINGLAQKIDVLLCGMETIGSAERSTDPDEMYRLFHEISDGMYADLLFRTFGRERVERELEEFLVHDFIPRCGGGIGVTRLIRAMQTQETVAIAH